MFRVILSPFRAIRLGLLAVAVYFSMTVSYKYLNLIVIAACRTFLVPTFDKVDNYINLLTKYEPTDDDWDLNFFKSMLFELLWWLVSFLFLTYTESLGVVAGIAIAMPLSFMLGFADIAEKFEAIDPLERSLSIR